MTNSKFTKIFINLRVRQYSIYFVICSVILWPTKCEKNVPIIIRLGVLNPLTSTNLAFLFFFLFFKSICF